MAQDLPEDSQIKTVPAVQIANDVIAVIAGMASAEVDGVAGMSGGIAGGLTEILGKKVPTRGVKLDIKETHVSLDLFVVVRYGSRIPEVASRIQDRVKMQVETMTGLHVTDVNIHVQGVSFDHHTGDGDIVHNPAASSEGLHSEH